MKQLPRAAHQREAREAAERFGASPFVVRCILELELRKPQAILDIPCGFGRHSLWLAAQGHVVTAADVAADRVMQVGNALAVSGCEGSAVVADATARLPFDAQAFDGAIIVDYVEPVLLRQIGRLVRPGGFLVYQTFSARGSNWRQLLRKGETEAILRPAFATISRHSAPAGAIDDERETLKLLARRRH